MIGHLFSISQIWQNQHCISEGRRKHLSKIKHCTTAETCPKGLGGAFTSSSAARAEPGCALDFLHSNFLLLCRLERSGRYSCPSPQRNYNSPTGTCLEKNRFKWPFCSLHFFSCVHSEDTLSSCCPPALGRVGCWLSSSPQEPWPYLKAAGWPDHHTGH